MIVILLLFVLLITSLGVWFIRKFIDKENISLILLVSLYTAISLYIFTNDNIVKKYTISDETAITIKALNNQSPKAEGNEIWIKGINIDGTYYKASEIFKDTTWLTEGDKVGWRSFKVPDDITNEVIGTIPSGRVRSIEFESNKWRGIASISIGNKTQNIDFYRDSTNNDVYKFELNGMNIYSSSFTYISALLAYLIILVNLSIICIILAINYIKEAKYILNFIIKEKTIFLIDLFISTAIIVLALHKLKITWLPIIFEITLLWSILLSYYLFYVKVNHVINIVNKIINLFKNYKMYIVILLAILVIMPNLDAVFRNRSIRETYNSESNGTEDTLEISKNVHIEQKINIDSKINKLQMQFDTFNRINNGKIEIIIRQNGNEYKTYMDMSTIESKKWYEIDVSNLQEGRASILVNGVDGERGTSVSLLMTNQCLFGGLYINNEAENKNIVINVETEAIHPLTYMRIGILLIIFILFCLSVKYIYKDDEEKSSFKLYLISIGIIVLTICIKYPADTFWAEPYYETGSNFFQQTYERGFRGSLFLDDAGYWPLFPRLISMFVIYILKQNHYAIVMMQFCSTIFLAMVCSRFCLKIYSKYFEKEIRFLMSLVIGLSGLIVYGQTTKFINFSYVGILLIIFNFLIDFNKLSRKQFIYILVTSIIVLSKGQYVVIVPIMIFAIVISLLKRNKRVFLYSISVLIFVSPQVLYLYKNMGSWGMGNEKIVDTLPTGFINALYYYVQSIARVIIPYDIKSVLNGFIFNSIGIILLLLLLVYFLYNLKNSKINKVHMILLGTLMLGYGSLLLICLTLNEFKTKVSWSDSIPIICSRTTVFSIISVVICIFLAVSLIENRKIKQIVIMTILGIMTIQCSIIPVYSPGNVWERSNWGNYYKMLEKESYVIPLNGVRFIEKNGEVLYIGIKDRVDESYWNYTYGGKLVKELSNEIKVTDNIDTGDIENFNSKSITSVYVSKYGIKQNNNITMILLDKYGEELKRVNAMPVNDRIQLGFILDKPISGVSKIKFIDDDGTNFGIKPEVYIGIEKF